MRREKRADKEEEKIKWGKLVGFLIAIILLCVAIVISMGQEEIVADVNYNTIVGTENNLPVEQASSELSRTVNQMKETNTAIENLIASIESNENVNNVIETNSNEVENNPEENENKENKAQETNEVNEETEPQSQFVFPVEGEVIKEFAKDSLIYSETLEEWITHTGIDIKANKASIVKAVADGTVKSIKNDPRYGLTITIEHSNGYVSSYSSLLTSEFVKEGENVKQGQTIGTVGNSAVFEVAEDNHLHFELLKDGSNINPEIYLK